MIFKLLILVNLLAFILMGYDKQQAKRRGWRVSENMLMAMAVVMGAGGILAGMYIFRHKTKHALFQYGAPLLLALNIFGLYYYLNYLSK